MQTEDLLTKEENEIPESWNHFHSNNTNLQVTIVPLTDTGVKGLTDERVKSNLILFIKIFTNQIQVTNLK